MAYSELIKNFERVREYMREFYVFGFRSRDQYTKKSARSYDDERRRMESWLGDYMRFRRTPEGKNVFISIDSRITRHNPLFRAWKAKSFTDGDITLHFILFDILWSPEVVLTLKELTERIDSCLMHFDEPRFVDESTVRKKLNEYVSEGIIVAEKRGKTMYYRRADDVKPCSPDILDFFSEVAPCGVIGSSLLDRAETQGDRFAFKHHYITGAMDSEILCRLFDAMREKRCVTVRTFNRRKDIASESLVVPLRIMVSVQNGKQNLMAYVPCLERINSFRTDNIVSVTPGDVCPEFDRYRGELDRLQRHMWGVNTSGSSGQALEHVEFTIKYAADEIHIRNRLEREKRCGTVERLDANTSRFSADVTDSKEMIPWIRTFICRIEDFGFSNRELEKQFRADLREMYAMYGVEGGDGA